MPRVLEPTLITSSPSVSPNGGGATAEIDFSFGNLEGALILGLVYYLQAISVQGELHVGINLDSDAAAPSASTSLVGDNSVFAYVHREEIVLGAAGNAIIDSRYLDLRSLDIVVARNLALQAFEVSGNARVAIVKIYYKRVQFTVNEVGGIIAFRR